MPERLLTVPILSNFLDTSDEWISKMTGIKDIGQMTIKNTSDLAYGNIVKAIADWYSAKI